MPDKVGVGAYLKYQGRFKKMLAGEDYQRFQRQVDDDWQRLLNKCQP